MRWERVWAVLSSVIRLVSVSDGFKENGMGEAITVRSGGKSVEDGMSAFFLYYGVSSDGLALMQDFLRPCVQIDGYPGD